MCTAHDILARLLTTAPLLPSYVLHYLQLNTELDKLVTADIETVVEFEAQVSKWVKAKVFVFHASQDRR